MHWTPPGEKLAYWQVGIAAPQGKMRLSLPRAWYSHSASVSIRRAPSACTLPLPIHSQKVFACCQVMQVTGYCSCAPAATVYVQLANWPLLGGATHAPA